MSLTVPKIVYGSGPTTLTFSIPPVNKDAIDERNAIRHATTASSGVTQFTTEHVELFRNLDISYIPKSEIAAWQAFIDDWALGGNTFDYYPDSTLDVFTTYTLEGDTDAMNVRFQYSIGKGGDIHYKTTLRLRQFVAVTDGT